MNKLRDTMERERDQLKRELISLGNLRADHQRLRDDHHQLRSAYDKLSKNYSDVLTSHKQVSIGVNDWYSFRDSFLSNRIYNLKLLNEIILNFSVHIIKSPESRTCPAYMHLIQKLNSIKFTQRA